MSSNNQAGKGSKYRTLSTETFAHNYDSIDWGHPKRKQHNGKQDSNTDNGKSTATGAKPGTVGATENVE
jgi:hypothetical protein